MVREKFKLFFSLVFLLFTRTSSNPDAKRLYDDLLSNYNRLIRPVSNNTDTVLVKLGLRLSQLIELVGKIFLLKLLHNSRITIRTDEQFTRTFFVSESQRSNFNHQRLAGTRKYASSVNFLKPLS